MKAIVIHAPHDLRVDEIAPAAAPAEGEVRVAISHGGICGSDLHYYHHGGFGAVRIREPMALGHEVSGIVAALGAGVTGLAPGDKVAVNPSRPCGVCDYCRRGQANQCLDMRFNGSAMRVPHEQGLFRAEVTLPARQAIRLSPGADLALTAMSEPLAVCLHAVRRAGGLVGKRVLVSGCGPIGCLTVAAARFAGAEEIIATDITASALAIARRIGADRAIDLAVDPAALTPLEAEKGQIDVVFECSGAPPALLAGLRVLRAGGTLVTVGLGPEVAVPVTQIVTRELNVIGSFRFDPEFATAARLIDAGRIDVGPMLTGVLPADEARAAFDLASDKGKAMKVQIAFAT
ncbi:L-idonate 5-dehydrogenase [Amaricoccus solimangrovi]|uniref:L-idonate 5-dehydrogenase n=1 Tax=Amaricoccus solimangrovi TaxID=2589815 RepID=A0A501WLS6_9RHOB|nr:L-idonate 5-dehydrogenase [Amaricoccus solimangrovi]TPE46636.1 L-idonate 5-dehydrogenase [Amaricoccus solimangrovi]